MKGPSVIQQIGFVLVATALLVLSGGMAWAAVTDYQLRGVIPPGVSVAGQPLGGLTAEQARQVIETAVSEPLLRPVTVTTPIGPRTIDPDGIVTVGVDEMLAEAFAARRTAPFAARLRADWIEPVDVSVEPTWTVDRDKIDAWVAALASEVDTPSLDASIGLTEDGGLRITASKKGRRVIQDKTADAIAAALVGEQREVKAATYSIYPKVTEDDFGRTIVVDKSKRRLYLYKGDKVERTWGVAIGTPGHPTPEGEWKIVLKRYMPTWVNPGSAWAKDMPKSIPPGYSNPLGLRALNLNASGIRIHGTSNIGSIGTAASHGCIRMRNSDIVQLYPLVDVGTTVYIIP